jgi:hypothetical protein
MNGGMANLCDFYMFHRVDVVPVLGRLGDLAGLTSVGSKFFFIGLPAS